jgi:hypothetical protein
MKYGMNRASHVQIVFQMRCKNTRTHVQHYVQLKLFAEAKRLPVPRHTK